MKYFGEQGFGKIVRLCYVSSGLVSVPLVPYGSLLYTVYNSHQFRHKLSLTESDVMRTYDLVSDFFLGQQYVLLNVSLICAIMKL
jgi:hypothetical protein